MACEFHEHLLFHLSTVEKHVKQLAAVMEEQQTVCSEDEMCAKVLLGKRIGSEMCVKVLLLLVSVEKRLGLKVEPEKLLPDVDGDLDVSRAWENHAKLVGGSDEAEYYQPTMSDLRLPDFLPPPDLLLFPWLLGTLAS